jgi:hypothetical protein
VLRFFPTKTPDEWLVTARRQPRGYIKAYPSTKTVGAIRTPLYASSGYTVAITRWDAIGLDRKLFSGGYKSKREAVVALMTHQKFQEGLAEAVIPEYLIEMSSGTRLKKGEAVEVFRVWAFWAPTAWCPGYKFVQYRKNGTQALVKAVGGTFDGVEFLYTAENVRRARG